MKGYRIAAMAVIGVLCCNTMAFAAPKPLEEAYEKTGIPILRKRMLSIIRKKFLIPWIQPLN